MSSLDLFHKFLVANIKTNNTLYLNSEFKNVMIEHNPSNDVKNRIALYKKISSSEKQELSQVNIETQDILYWNKSMNKYVKLKLKYDDKMSVTLVYIHYLS